MAWVEDPVCQYASSRIFELNFQIFLFSGISRKKMLLFLGKRVLFEQEAMAPVLEAGLGNSIQNRTRHG